MNKETINTALGNLADVVGIKGFWKHEGPLDGILQIFVREQSFPNNHHLGEISWNNNQPR